MQEVLPRQAECSPEQAAGWRLAHEAHPVSVENARLRAERLIGSIATSETVAVDTEPNPTTLLANVQLAALGDALSRQSLGVNIGTAAAEILYKAGHKTSVLIDIQDGKLTQSGQDVSDIQANALRYSTLNPIMKKRTAQELENVFTFENLIASGAMDSHDAVVFSFCPKDSKTMKDYGFFADTATCSAQMMRLQDGQTVELETALLAGKRNPNAPRHDVRAVETIARENGAEVLLDDVDEGTSYIMLVPKESAPNGIVDIVAQYDVAVGGVFYGQEIESGEAQDYQVHASECERQNKSFSGTVEKVTKQLLAEAHTLKTPLDAIKRLHKLTEQHLVANAVNDGAIDAHVFGPESAGYITSARSLMESGDQKGALTMQQKAIETAVSSTCPLFGGADSSDSEKNILDMPKVGEDRYGSLEFKCQKGHLNTRPHNILIEKCKTCGISVKC